MILNKNTFNSSIVHLIFLLMELYLLTLVFELNLCHEHVSLVFADN